MIQVFGLVYYTAYFTLFGLDKKRLKLTKIIEVLQRNKPRCPVLHIVGRMRSIFSGMVEGGFRHPGTPKKGWFHIHREKSMNNEAVGVGGEHMNRFQEQFIRGFKIPIPPWHETTSSLSMIKR